MATPSVEIQFAQRLAANEKTTRDRALKKLRKYIRSRSTSSAGFGEDELIKLWKGLHYCMWMQDKPLLQEDLAVQITRLMFSFPDLETRLTFFRVFLLTESREWNGIDRLRLDKFMMLVRQMLSQTLTVLQQMGWTKEGVNSWVQTLHSTLLDPNSDRVPDSLNMHLADIFLTELTRIGAEQLDSEKILRCLTVFDNYLQVGKRPLVLSRILSSVYDVLIDQTRERRHHTVSETETEGGVESEKEKRGGAKRETKKGNGEKEGDGQEEASSGDSDSGYDEDSQPKLKFDSELIADHLFQLGSDEKCSNSNRQRIYSTVKRLRDASSAALVEGEGEEYDPDEDMEAAVERLNKLNPVKRKKKKKKQREEEDESEDDQEEEEVKKDGKKKNKRKLDESEAKGQEKAKVTSKDSRLKDQDTGSEAKKAKFDEKDSSKLTEANNDQKKKKRKRKKKKKAKVAENESTKTTTSSDGTETATKVDNSVLNVDGREVSKTGKELEQLKIAENKVSQISDHSVKSSRKKRRRTQDKPDVEIPSKTKTEEIPSKKTKTEEKPSKTKSESDSNSSSSISKQLFKDNTPIKKTKTPSKKFQTPCKKTETPSKKAETPSKKTEAPSQRSDGKTVESLTSEFDEPLKEGETEIWVPSKKYQKTKNKSGRTPKPKSVEASEPSADVSPKPKTPNLAEEKIKMASAKGKKSSAGSDFAKFEKVPTPVAFVKKALVKASAGTPSRKTDMVIKSTPELTASEKKVKFNMKRNTAQKFEDSMAISPLPAFLPAKSPVQGILKSPATPPATPLGTRTPGSKKNRRRKLTSPVESKQGNTPVLMLSSKKVESGSNPKQSGIKSKNTPNKKTKGTPMTKRKSLQLEKNLETPKSRKKSFGGNEPSTPQMTPKSAKKNKKMHSTPDTETKLKKTPKSGKKVTKANSETPKVGKKNSKMFTPKSTPKTPTTPGDKRPQASDFF